MSWRGMWELFKTILSLVLFGVTVWLAHKYLYKFVLRLLMKILEDLAWINKSLKDGDKDKDK